MLGATVTHAVVNRLEGEDRVEIEKFLKLFVEGYLFHDLRKMDEITLGHGEVYGKACYPMLASVAAGIELLGYLTSDEPLATETTDPKRAEHQANDHFTYYWANYLSKVNKRYKPFVELFRELVRNGLAHMFLAKPGVFVDKGLNSPIPHLATNGQVVFVNCTIFAADFVQSYNHFVRPIVFDGREDGKTNKAKMQRQLDNLLERYSAKSDEKFPLLPPRTHTLRSELEVTNLVRDLTTPDVSGTISIPRPGETITTVKLRDDPRD